MAQAITSVRAEVDAAQAAGDLKNPLPAPVLAQYLLDSWEGALLRMRVRP
mgnify:CR=1 FL=1